MKLVITLSVALVLANCGDTTETESSNEADQPKTAESPEADCNLGEPPLDEAVWIENQNVLARVDPTTGDVIATTSCLDIGIGFGFLGAGPETMWLRSGATWNDEPITIHRVDRNGSTTDVYEFGADDDYPASVIELDGQVWFSIWVDEDGDDRRDRVEFRLFDSQTFEFSDVVDVGMPASMHSTGSELLVHDVGATVNDGVIDVMNSSGEMQRFPSTTFPFLFFSSGPDGSTWASAAAALHGFGFYRLDPETGQEDSYQYINDYEGRGASGDRSTAEDIVIGENHAYIIDSETPVQRLLKVSLNTGEVSKVFDLCAECEGRLVSVSESSLILAVKQPDEFLPDYQLIDTGTFDTTNLDLEGTKVRTNVRR